jgi:hypothetical protein
MARGLKIERYEPRKPNFWRDGVIRTRLVVVEAFGDIVPEVFVYERQPPNPATGVIHDVFQSVASRTDLDLYPVNAPDPDLSDKFFRTNVIELDLCGQPEFDEFLAAIHADICGLIDALAADDVMVMEDEKWCGDQPAVSAP